MKIVMLKIFVYLLKEKRNLKFIFSILSGTNPSSEFAINHIFLIIFSDFLKLQHIKKNKKLIKILEENKIRQNLFYIFNSASTYSFSIL